MRFTQLIILAFFMLPVAAQDGRGLQVGTIDKYLSTVDAKYKRVQGRIDFRSSQLLNRLRKQELKLAKKIAKTDSAAASKLRFNTNVFYDGLTAKLKQANKAPLKEYIPAYDSALTSVQFLAKGVNVDERLNSKVAETKASLLSFSSRLQAANDLKKQISERRQQLKQEFDRLGLTKHLKHLNKEVYYYQQQLNEIKAIVSNPEKAEKKILALLRENETFKLFASKNSILAQLFPVPESSSNIPISFAGLQTRATVQTILTDRFAGAGINPQQLIQQQVQAAEELLNTAKQKLSELTSNISGDIEMPQGFKPNNQKTKTFLQRIEYGANVQTQKVHSYMPVTLDMALTAGYKLNDKSVIGFGASYKMGWGQGLDKIKISHEGIGLRSYIDVRLKGSFWITGGYEQNYYQRFSELRETSDAGLWTKSALLGITKKLMIAKNKSTKVQLLYDAFYQKNAIQTQPIIFRIGYSFK